MKNYNTAGLPIANAGAFQRARELFRAELIHNPNRGDVWSNVGLSLHMQAEQLLGEGTLRRKMCLAMLRESIAAFEVGTMLKNAQADLNRASAIRTFEKHFSGECFATDCARYEAERKAMVIAEEKMEHLSAVNSLCTSEEALTVEFTCWEREYGLVHSETMRRIMVLLRVCGTVVLRHAHPPGVVASVARYHDEDTNKFIASRGPDWLIQLHNASGINEGVEFSGRGLGRFERKFPLRQPYMDPRFVAPPLLLGPIKAILSPAIELDTFSAVTSMPRPKSARSTTTDDQAWHADVSTLFPRVLQGEQSYIPPHGLVAITGLGNYSTDSGPTEFYMGSHVSMGIDFWVDSVEDNSQTPRIELVASPESVILFDLRVVHRGKANRSKRKRSIAYLGYVKDWFYDVVNFKHRQTVHFDQIPLKKLFTRLDSFEYTRRLEHMLTTLGYGDDLHSLKSRGGYKQVNLMA